MSAETYRRSNEIENFLRYTLNPKRGSEQDNKLKGAFEGIVHYENGGSLLNRSQIKREFDWLRKKFATALEKLANPTYSDQVENLNCLIQTAEDSEDIWNIFNQMKELKEKVFRSA
ncbi:hypothetical protein [Owenweeksia hongkongensis]|uniref:hypothetical protein n=1 Tax=Owenweeksia hongkongensis TaxID=253245 RepID=UPI003A95B958